MKVITYLNMQSNGLVVEPVLNGAEDQGSKPHHVLNSLTPICIRVGIKNYRSVEFLCRNSTFFLHFSKHKTTPNHTPPW